MDNTVNNAEHGHSGDRAFLFSSLHQPGTILLESSRRDPHNTNHYLFHTPLETLSALTVDEIPELFRRIEHHRSLGHWIAGYAGYECGYHFESIVPSFVQQETLPLAWFGIYAEPMSVDSAALDDMNGSVPTAPVEPGLSIPKEDYVRMIERLKNYIVNGDTYQVNFTDRFEFGITGDPRDLYLALRSKQHVPFSAYLNLGDTQVLSFSPELFFRIEEDIITTKPMKGTCKRGKTNDEDRRLSEWLQHDEKNRSENLMIVDLLRNDIGRICQNGSVTVRDMYAIERFETVLQMTSTVIGKLRPQLTYYEIFKALFPCGSVTGAPKIRTMQIIHETEQHPRGVYCGAIGYIAPDDRSVFSVAIRTVTVKNNGGIMGVGSGIVYDSDPETEYDECRLKAAFLLNELPEFHLLETILWNGAYSLLELHLARLQSSAEYFQIPCPLQKITELLQSATGSFRDGISYRVRLLLSRRGDPSVEPSEYTPPSVDTIRISPERTDSGDRFLYHKTTHRQLYDRYSKSAAEEGLADYLFLNERNEITEGSVTNIFIEQNGLLITPPLHCGILPGVYRNEVLRTNPQSVEKIITVDDVRGAEALYLCNSLRGWTKVTLSE